MFYLASGALLISALVSSVMTWVAPPKGDENQGVFARWKRHPARLCLRIFLIVLLIVGSIFLAVLQTDSNNSSIRFVVTNQEDINRSQIRIVNEVYAYSVRCYG